MSMKANLTVTLSTVGLRRKRQHIIWLLIGLIVLGSTTATESAANSPDNDLQALIMLFTGSYMSEPTEGARESRPILLRVVTIEPPPGYRHAMYSEMRHDGPDGDIYRQNLLLFDESPGRDGNTMTALNFTDRDTAAGLLQDPALLATGQLATTENLGPGCSMHFRRDGKRFLGRIEPAHCMITSRNGGTLHIEAETLLRADAIEQLERGFSPDGQLMFGNSDGRRYVWPRLTGDSTQLEN